MIKLIISFREKYNYLSIGVKAAIWFTLCNFCLQGITFITAPLYSRILSTDEYGLMSLFMTYQQIFNILSTFELSQGAYQRGLVKYANDIVFFTNSLQLLSTLIVTLNFFITIFLFNNNLISFTRMPLSMILLMFIFYLVNPSYNMWLAKKRFNYEYKHPVILTLMYSIVPTLITFVVLLFYSNTAVVKIETMIITQILFCLPFYFKNINFKELFKRSRDTIFYMKKSLIIQIPLLFHSISYLILGQSDRIMIGLMVDNKSVAMYSIAYNIGVVVIVFQQSLNLVLRPWRYKVIEKQNYNLLRRNTNQLITVFAIIICIFVLIAPDFIIYLFGNAYSNSIWVIPPVSLGVYYILLYSIFTDVETYLGKTRYIMYVSCFCALLNMVLNFVGIKFFGYIACAYTTLICYVIFSLLHCLFTKKILRNEIYKKSFNDKYILLVSMLTNLIVFIFSFSYINSAIRHVLIILLIACLCVFYKKVTKYIKSMLKL